MVEVGHTEKERGTLEAPALLTTSVKLAGAHDPN